MKVVKRELKRGTLIGVTVEVEAKQEGKANILIEATLPDPDERQYWELPVRVELTLRYMDEPQSLLAVTRAYCMTAGYHGNVAFEVMDSYSADMGAIGYELFVRRCKRYPAGNLVILDYQGDVEPHDDLFEKDFDLLALIDDIVFVCNGLMVTQQRKADYFVFYGHEGVCPSDVKWEKRLAAEGCDIIECDWGAFMAVHKTHL